MVAEGKDTLFDMEKLEDLGGVESMTDLVIRSLVGVTHVLLPSCGTSLLPILPSLLVVLPPTLVVLDLSANDFTFLPGLLTQCSSLEELDVSRNPLRQLPAWIGELTSLRVLVVDDCGIQNLPVELSHLSGLHTIWALPAWLCLLGQLETLRVEGNPFAPEWVPVIAPILAGPSRLSQLGGPTRTSSQSRSPRLTSIRDGLSMASLHSSCTSASVASAADSPSNAMQVQVESWMSPSSPASPSMYLLSPPNPIAEHHPRSAPIRAPDERSTPPVKYEPTTVPASDSPSVSRELRKTRSAGALLGDGWETSTQRVMGGMTSAAIAPMLSVFGMKRPVEDVDPAEAPTLAHPPANRYASLRASEGRRAASVLGNYVDRDDASSTQERRPSGPMPGGKWGFLRKMSMSRLRVAKDKSTSLSASAVANVKSMPPLHHLHSEPLPTVPRPAFGGAKSAVTLPLLKAFASTMDVNEFGQSPARTSVSATTLRSAIGAGGMGLPPVSETFGNTGVKTTPQIMRRSFPPIDPTPPTINIHIPSVSPFISTTAMFEPARSEGQMEEATPPADAASTLADRSSTTSSSSGVVVMDSPAEMEDDEARYVTGLESIRSYLRDLHDLSRQPIEPYGGFEVVGSSTDAGSVAHSSVLPDNLGSPRDGHKNWMSVTRRAWRPTVELLLSKNTSTASLAPSEEGSLGTPAEDVSAGGKDFKKDRVKRAKIIREIYETERTYVRGLGELVSIYVEPASLPIKPGQPETVVPATERKIVFGGVESILTMHRDNLLPALEKAVQQLLEEKDDDEGRLSTQTAHDIGEALRTYIAYMKQYSTYISNFDNALTRMKTWTTTTSSAFPGSAPPTPPLASKPPSPNPMMAPGSAGPVGMMSFKVLPIADGAPHSGNHMTTGQKKRVKTFLKRCRGHPNHSQINLESYLLLPIQRVPRYKLLLQDLAMCTSPGRDGQRDPLQDALNKISCLASLMNEEKRDADSRLRLFHWQQRISSGGPSRLVQPHRKLLLEGPLTLIAFVRKANSFVEVDNSSSLPFDGGGDGDPTLMPSSRSAKVVVPVEYIVPEPINRSMMLILCSDLMVLVQQRPGADGWEGTVDLFDVAHMATVREPASVVNGNVLRVVDNKSIYYFNGGSHSNNLQWCHAINSARRR